ncbi:MAG: hypothetical protein A3F68_11445 [Acidobacteria bacterium RIFCSPLOWO2_12_FULL_54_10]|nr:MAG: hypothetical protein A3F68_11445 [Acidobacteria bacterium RIFCSPLOWO2_12_FULL_54_10]
MAERVILSLWLGGFTEQTMLGLWRKALDEFPASCEFPGVRGMTIYPLDWTSSPIQEQTFAHGTTAEYTVVLAEEFLHADYAYEAQLWWDLWAPKSEQPEDGWERSVRIVSVICLGPEFDPEEAMTSGNLQVHFGLDSAYLPPDFWQVPDEQMRQELSGPQLRENLDQIIACVHKIEKKLPVSKRLLGCESGESLADKLMGTWGRKI